MEQQIEGAVVIHLDDFIFPKAQRYQVEFPQWYYYYYLQWRYDYLINQVPAPLKQGLAVSGDMEFYSKLTDRYDMRRLHIPIGTNVIVEGVFLQRNELRPYFDVVLFLENK